MSSIAVVVVILTSVAVAVFVSWPLLTGKPRGEEGEERPEEGTLLDELLIQKDATYSSLKELEFDHAMGNLSSRDYQELTSRYEDKAVALLQKIDDVASRTQDQALGAKDYWEDPIEEQVAARRQRSEGLRVGGTTKVREMEIEEEVAALREGKRYPGRSAAEVAQSVEEEIAFLRTARRRLDPPEARHDSPEVGTCPTCHTAIKTEKAAFCSRCGTSLLLVCGKCGRPVDREDAFCAGCGAALVDSKQHDMEADAVLGGTNG